MTDDNTPRAHCGFRWRDERGLHECVLSWPHDYQGHEPEHKHEAEEYPATFINAIDILPIRVSPDDRYARTPPLHAAISSRNNTGWELLGPVSVCVLDGEPHLVCTWVKDA